jgi:leukotriene-A4 hydrolase
LRNVLQAGESITGIAYEWGVYDMVVLPTAFPYGGMENPNLTFLSASLIAGDRSLTRLHVARHASRVTRHTLHVTRHAG